MARPILKDIRLQDVVFAGGAGTNVNAHAAADRASATKLTHLDAQQKRLEKADVQAVRKGCKKNIGRWLVMGTQTKLRNNENMREFSF